MTLGEAEQMLGDAMASSVTLPNITPAFSMRYVCCGGSWDATRATDCVCRLTWWTQRTGLGWGREEDHSALHGASQRGTRRDEWITY